MQTRVERLEDALQQTDMRVGQLGVRVGFLEKRVDQVDAKVVLLTTAEIASQRNEAAVKGFLKGWYLKEEKR
eukprot:4606971-Alexandrium_andersonii.AAC.1